MKKNFSMIAMVIGLSALAGSSQLAAQDVRETGNIPFDFQAGSQRLAAGDYTVSRDDANGILTVRNNETGRAIFTGNPVASGSNHNEAKLVFHKYGERYFLAEVWFPQVTSGLMLPKSKMEKEYAAEMNSSKPQVVYLAMR